MSDFEKIRSLIQEKAEAEARLNLIPYDGSPEVKENKSGKYLYDMRTLVFIDGNKRAAVLFCNHYLIANGGGLLIVPEQEVPEFKSLLDAYYESADDMTLRTFLREKCWIKVRR